LTGILLIPSTFLRIEIELPLSLTAPLRISTTALHSIFSYLMIAVVGALATHHFSLGWKMQKKRKTGLSVFLIFVLLALTGIAIYYIGDQELSVVASFAHLSLGLLLPILYVIHLYFSFVQKKKNSEDEFRLRD